MKVFKIVVRSICCVLALLLIFVVFDFVREQIQFITKENLSLWHTEEHIQEIKRRVFKESCIAFSFACFCAYYIIESIFVLFPSLKASKTEKANKKRAKLQKKLDKLNTESGE